MTVSAEKKAKAKEKIIEAALELFFYQGFSGTTVRQIASKAEVNQALISYYFNGKKGLLEELMIRFYESYFLQIDLKEDELQEQKQRSELSSCQHLVEVMETTFTYLFSSFKMTRFIYRELTMDSMLVREVMTIYLSREKHYYISILEEAIEKGELQESNVEMTVLQLINLLYMPFLQPQVIQEVYYFEPTSTEFETHYLAQMRQWIMRLFQP